jgi:hypothetical protein
MTGLTDRPKSGCPRSHSANGSGLPAASRHARPGRRDADLIGFITNSLPKSTPSSTLSNRSSHA